MKETVSIVIVAGGVGSRMQSDVPKQFLELNGYPIFMHAMHIFHNTFPNCELILVMHKAHLNEARHLVESYHPDYKVNYTTGGENRFESVKKGLNNVHGDFVMIHDAVRPFINSDLLIRLLKSAKTNGNAIPAIPVAESVRLLQDNYFKTINRDHIKLIQTPQVFKTQLLQKAYNQKYQPFFTDDATVFETLGEKIILIDGDPNNFKITYPIDYEIAKAILANDIINSKI